MTETNSKERMTMYMSRSGKGCNMVTPNGKKNVFCNLNELVEFLEGKSNFVDFTLAKRNTTSQESLDSVREDEKDE